MKAKAQPIKHQQPDPLDSPQWVSESTIRDPIRTALKAAQDSPQHGHHKKPRK